MTVGTVQLKSKTSQSALTCERLHVNIRTAVCFAELGPGSWQGQGKAQEPSNDRQTHVCVSLTCVVDGWQRLRCWPGPGQREEDNEAALGRNPTLDHSTVYAPHFQVTKFVRGQSGHRAQLPPRSSWTQRTRALARMPKQSYRVAKACEICPGARRYPITTLYPTRASRPEVK